MQVLVTGIAGFIGFHTAKCLLEQGHQVIGIDNINDYYDVNLKYGRLRELGIDQLSADSGCLELSQRFAGLQFRKLSLEDRVGLDVLRESTSIEAICHFAAQAGVRYSIENPHAYIQANLEGFLNILELARQLKVQHLVYASSSSVYGLNAKQPFSTADTVDHPVSLYAATKKSNELMAHSYSHLYGIPTTGLRFFTVYGPWGRPDMALFLFAKAIFAAKPIDVFNNGNMERDFTYIDDIVTGVVKVLAKPPHANPQWDAYQSDPASSSDPYRVYNIGNGSAIQLLDFIRALEKASGKVALKNLKPLQPGDVLSTWADTSDLERDIGFKPQVTIGDGVARFVAWYKQFYSVEDFCTKDTL